MLWLILLAVATCLTIALRRVLRKQKPLNDELYSKAVAVEHVQSGVAWVRADGRFGFVNQSFAKAFDLRPEDFASRVWFEVFSQEDRPRLRQAYDQALLMGITNVNTDGLRSDGSRLWLNVRLVMVHDHKMRLVGLHCLIEDRTRERALEDRIGELEAALGKACAPSITEEHQREVVHAPEVPRFTPRPAPVSAATVVRRAMLRMGSPVTINR